jgi:tetratricopeptide (TPR) repeat protein
LLQRHPVSEAEPRFLMLDTIREYGLEQLTETDELEGARMAHATHFLEFASRDAPVPSEPASDDWFCRLVPERDNLVSAFDFLCRPETVELCLQFAAALGLFWAEQGPHQEGWSRLKRATELAPVEPTRLKAEVLLNASALAMYAGHFPEATALAKDAQSVAEALRDRTILANAIHMRAWIEELQEHWDTATTLLEQALAMWTDLGNAFGQGMALMLLGGQAYVLGDLDLARSREERAAGIFRAAGESGLIASTDWYLGFIAVAEGKRAEAARMYEQSLQTWLTTDAATHRFKPLVGLADIDAASGRFDAASRLLGAVDHLLESQAVRLFPFDVPGYQRAEGASAAALGDKAFSALKDQGRDMSPEEWLLEADAIVRAAEERR